MTGPKRRHRQPTHLEDPLSPLGPAVQIHLPWLRSCLFPFIHESFPRLRPGPALCWVHQEQLHGAHWLVREVDVRVKHTFQYDKEHT